MLTGLKAHIEQTPIRKEKMMQHPDVVIIMTDEERNIPPYENEDLKSGVKLPSSKTLV